MTVVLLDEARNRLRPAQPKPLRPVWARWAIDITAAGVLWALVLLIAGVIW